MPSMVFHHLIVASANDNRSLPCHRLLEPPAMHREPFDNDDFTTETLPIPSLLSETESLQLLYERLPEPKKRFNLKRVLKIAVPLFVSISLLMGTLFFLTQVTSALPHFIVVNATIAIIAITVVTMFFPIRALLQYLFNLFDESSQP